MSTLDDITKVAPAKPVVVSTPAPAPSLEIKPKSMTDIYTQLTRKPDVEIDPKRERNRAIVSAIGDGLSALSNLYFTTKGAPSVEQPKLSEKNVARYNYLKDLRGKQEAAYNAGLMNAMDRDYQISNNERQWDYRSSRDRVEDNRYKDNLSLSKEKLNATVDQNAIMNALKAADLERKSAYDKERLSATKNSNELGWANLSESKRHHNLIYKVGKEKAESKKDIITVYERDGKTKKVDRRLLTPENISAYLQNAVKVDKQPFTKEGIMQSPAARKLARDIGEYMKQEDDVKFTPDVDSLFD